MKISIATLEQEFLRVLDKRVEDKDIAKECAHEFAQTTAYGVLSHGVNRFPVFIGQMDKGDVKPIVKPELVSSLGCIEVYDGNLGIGNLTAKRMMDRAIDLADKNGVGIIALKNTNHWMRGGSYGYQAAKKGFIALCWTNSIAVMPAWGTKECCIGTNPLIVAVPSDPITLVDMSMSMFSYGKLQNYRLAGKQLPIDGGFDDNGNLTKDPGTIEKNKQILPTGFWKGSGLSIVLDMIAVALSGGKSVRDITEQGTEKGVTQIFIVIKPTCDHNELATKLNNISDYILKATPRDPNAQVRIPGHELEKRYQNAMTNGVEVSDEILNQIKAL